MAENFDQIKKRRQEKAAQRDKENAELAREQQNLKVVEQSVPENHVALPTINPDTGKETVMFVRK